MTTGQRSSIGIDCSGRDALAERSIATKERVGISFPIGIEHAAERHEGRSHAERRNEANAVCRVGHLTWIGPCVAAAFCILACFAGLGLATPRCFASQAGADLDAAEAKEIADVRALGLKAGLGR